MGHGDIVTREYMRKNEIFADAFNYMIYGGRQVIEQDLMFGSPSEVTEQQLREVHIKIR